MARSRNFRLLALATVLATLTGCAIPQRSPWGPADSAAAAGGMARPAVKEPKNQRTEEPKREGDAPAKPAIPQSTPGSAGASPSPDHPSDQPPIIRGQSPAYAQPPAGYPADTMPGGYPRGPQPVSGGAPSTSATYAYQPPAGVLSAPPLPPPPAGAMPNMPGSVSPFTPAYPGFQPPTNVPPEVTATPTPLDVYVEETRTGQFMFGVAVNSNNGVTGQIVLQERNFDITRFPTSWDDFLNGTAWRGAGQGFRIEAMPGNRLQRYLISFTEPYFLDTNVSFDASAFYFDRAYFDWTESRYGGRLAWGTRLTPDLSLSGALRAENINIFNPRVTGVPQLDAVLGHSDLYTGRITLRRDTRDIPFMPTEGQLIELAYEQAFGSFDFPRGELNYSQYYMVRQRPDGSGRHTLAYSTRLGFSGSDTPIFENYFAGGFSTLRGFSFRGASPLVSGVRVGGPFQWLNSLEYFFPLTADDMIRGTVFCDFGTVEQNVAIHANQFRVAPGVGVRINVPALGPAPLAFDFAFPVASAATDDKQTFSFFFGIARN